MRRTDKALNQWGNLIRRRVQGEMTGIQHVDSSLRDIFAVALGSPISKERSYFAQDHEEARQLLAHPGLPFRPGVYARYTCCALRPCIHVRLLFANWPAICAWEFAVGQGHGYLWRLNNYWRLEEKDGGVYVQVESIALSRDVPVIFAWFVNPLIRRVSLQTLANLLYGTRRGLLRADTGARAEAWERY